MKNSFILLLFPLSLLSQQLYYSPILEFRNDTAYMRGYTTSYTGLYEVFYDFDFYHGRYLKSRGYFRDGIPHGQFVSYYENKNLESQEYYINGVKHGNAHYRYMGGYLKRKESYKNGMLDGKPAITEWYSSGQPKEAAYYHNNVLDTVIYYEEDSYHLLLGIIPGEADSAIKRNELTVFDTIRPLLIGLVREKKPGSERAYFDIYDTVWINDFEINSIIIKSGETTLISKSEIISDEMKDFFSEASTGIFIMTIWLSNKDGILWNLPARKIYIR